VIWCSLATVACLAGIIDSLTAGAAHLPEVLWVIPLVGVLPVALFVAALLFRRECESPVRTLAG
jgi:hypothetical protein